MCEVQGARLIFNNCGNIFCLDAAGQQLHAPKNTLQFNFELHYVNDVNLHSNQLMEQENATTAVN